MRHISLTSFGRGAVSAEQIAQHETANTPLSHDNSPNKWGLLRALTTARRDYGISDRDLHVLAALLSFYPYDELRDDDRLIVFPSNRALAERSHGMAESTLRRHLAALVSAGLLHRHDSPNGKRYALRGPGGRIALAFGFDLSPLLRRCDEILMAAERTEERQARCKILRTQIAVCLRDSSRLAEQTDNETITGQITELSRCMRRKLNETELAEIAQRAKVLRNTLVSAQPRDVESEKMSGKDIRNERHIQESDKNILESDIAYEKYDHRCTKYSTTPDTDPLPPLELVLDAIPEARKFTAEPIESWSDLVKQSRHLAPMMGISAATIQEAEHVMGPYGSAVTLACMLQDFGKLRKPGGYLRCLTRKSAIGQFSPGNMVLALLRREAA